MRFLAALLAASCSGLVYMLLFGVVLYATWEDNWPLYTIFGGFTILLVIWCIWSYYKEEDPQKDKKQAEKSKKRPESMDEYFDRMAAERKKKARKRKVVHYNDLLTKEERGDF